MFAILAGNETFVTDAIISVIGVDALAVVADALLLAFVCFTTFVGIFISLLSSWAIASERTDRVHARTAFAKRRNCLALVDINALTAVNIAEESFVTVQFSRTLLARMAPSFAHGGAAQLFSAHNTLQLALAHVIVDFREARARPVISLAATSGESVNTCATVGTNTTSSVQTRLSTNTIFAGFSGESRTTDAFFADARASILAEIRAGIG